MTDRNEPKEIPKLLEDIQEIINRGLDVGKTASILYLMGCPVPEESLLSEIRLYSEYLPLAHEYPFTQDQRYLHFLWEAMEKSPLCLATNFTFPFRRYDRKETIQKMWE